MSSVPHLVELLQNALRSLNSLGLSRINLTPLKPLTKILNQYQKIFTLLTNYSIDLLNDLHSAFSLLLTQIEYWDHSESISANSNSSQLTLFDNSLKSLKTLMITLILIQDPIDYNSLKADSKKLYKTYKDQELNFMMLDLKASQILKGSFVETEKLPYKSVLLTYFPCFFHEISDLTINEIRRCLGLKKMMTRFKIREVVYQVFGSLEKIRIFQEKNSKYSRIEKALKINKVDVDKLLQDTNKELPVSSISVFTLPGFSFFRERVFNVGPKGLISSGRYVADRLITIGKNDESFKNDISIPKCSNDDTTGVDYFIYISDSSLHFVDISLQHHAKIRVSSGSKRRVTNRQVIEFAGKYKLLLKIRENQLKFKLIQGHPNNEAIAGIENREVRGNKFSVGSSTDCTFQVSDQSCEAVELTIEHSLNHFYLHSHSDQLAIYLKSFTEQKHQKPSSSLWKLEANDLVFMNNFGLIFDLHK